MKKTIIGLRQEFLLAAVAASVAGGAACLFLPYASVGGESITMMGILNGGCCLWQR